MRKQAGSFALDDSVVLRTAFGNNTLVANQQCHCSSLSFLFLANRTIVQRRLTLSSPIYSPSFHPHMPLTHHIAKMCKRTTTAYTSCAHLVKDHAKCSAASAYTSLSSPPQDIWCKKEMRFVINESCRPCRQKSNAAFKERARKHRTGERPYRPAVGCVVM